MSGDVMQLVTQFKTACANYDINAIDSHTALCETLDALAGDLGKDGETRIQFGVGEVWTEIHKLWRDLVHAQLTFWDGDDSDDGDDAGSIKERKKQHSLSSLCVSLARFMRNLVAGVSGNQIKAFEDEPIIRRLLHYYTSWSSIENEEASFTARILTQMLSNIITGNEALISNLWETYLNLQEDQVILIRLLASPDNRILLAVLTMIINCVRESRSRTKMLTRTPIGARICIILLDDMVKLYDADEGSEGARAFDVGYSIFTRIIETGLMPDLYTELAIMDEIVTPHQTTLLKLLDSYLQSTPVSSPGTQSRITKTHVKLCPMLSNLFFSLSTYAQTAMRRSLLPSVPNAVQDHSIVVDVQGPPAQLDVLLPKVCEALVLTAQCIITITLAAHSHHHSSPTSSNSTASTHESIHAFFNQIHLEGVGLVENLVELLRLLDRFLPRINFGKPVATSAGPTVEQTKQKETPAPSVQAPTPAPGNPGFNFLKRDLVRLLGILCNEDRAVQDRLRKCGGIELVLNLCVIDERNPYLREHAIFALHNLLKDNPANQAVVEEIKPTGQWDENGVLKDTPRAVRK
ncbi:spinocerebellar ataxia type 10 protein domain-containing protein [Lentinula edodes]|uniref:spinocerebellar ataxia type 10 protein domain-containing protein n=1 Tax=Lentinula edodes TaxID=5353 RepID=UPI001E8DA2B0|nr:spinocerebellar ataxia type 10 protein domain-containing protein [Lentinula edodes]KAH7872988.1 spinocerebellar ataxia type 10 protein domain-containing protein [Lentinula edodes]